MFSTRRPGARASVDPGEQGQGAGHRDAPSAAGFGPVPSTRRPLVRVRFKELRVVGQRRVPRTGRDCRGGHASRRRAGRALLVHSPLPRRFATTGRLSAETADRERSRRTTDPFACRQRRAWRGRAPPQPNSDPEGDRVRVLLQPSGGQAHDGDDPEQNEAHSNTRGVPPHFSRRAQPTGEVQTEAVTPLPPARPG